MSSIVNKIKEAVHSDKHSSHAEGTSGPHSSRTANAADPRVDSDRDGSHTVGGTTGGIGGTTGGLTGTHNTHGTHGGLTGTHNTTAGPHSSNLANKADPRVDSDRDGSHNLGMSSGPATNTAGPHSSNLANKVDPRVDSDRDGSNRLGGTTGGIGGTTGGLTGTHGTHGTHGGLTGSHNTTAGPHSSNMANKLDPRVDSDRDGSHAVGGTTGGFGGTTGGLTGSHGTTGGLTGSHGTTGGLTGTHGGLTGGHNTTAGPHSSNIANKVDPRVDSDRDGSHTVGGATGGFGGTTSGIGGPTGGLTGSHGTHGTHGGLTGSTFGSGPAPHTAGPHKSDALNKIDPRVDSDRDGSTTLGGNQTYRS